MNTNLQVALISAGAAVFGALAGGGATYLATVETQQSERAREERRVDVEAQGAARLLISELSAALSFSEVVAEPGVPPAAVAPFGVEVSPSDLKLVFSRLTVMGYRDVAGALSMTQAVQLLVQRWPKNRPIDADTREIARASTIAIRRGVRALRSVARLPANVPNLS